MPLIFHEMPIQIGSQEAQIQEVVLYPASEDVTGEITDDGVSPVYRPASIDSTTAGSEAAATAAWSETVPFESEGTITIVSIFYEFEWQSRYVAGNGAGTTSSSKIQVTGNGGTTWTDLTDNYNNTSATLTTRIRAGVSNVLTSITAGANQLGFRLVHWTNGSGTDASEANVRTNSYARITYRKT